MVRLWGCGRPRGVHTVDELLCVTGGKRVRIQQGAHQRENALVSRQYMVLQLVNHMIK